MSNKLQDPTYDFAKDGSLPVNAFVEPNNPEAVFPQHAKPHILDFRSHKMAASGFASVGNFRKIMSNRTKKSKYETIIKTPVELEAERIENEMNQQMEEERKKQQMEDDDEVDASKMKKADYTIDDITQGMTKQMKISKKKKKGTDVDMMEASKAIKKILPGEKVAALKMKHKNKRSRSQLKF